MSSTYPIVDTEPPPPPRTYPDYTTRENTESDESSSWIAPTSRTRSVVTTRSRAAYSERSQSRGAPTIIKRSSRYYDESSSSDETRDVYHYGGYHDGRRLRTAIALKARSPPPHEPLRERERRTPAPRNRRSVHYDDYYMSNPPPPPPIEIDINTNAPVYSFIPSRAGSSTPSIDGTKSSDGDSVQNVDPESASGAPGVSDNLFRGMQILESQYVGQGAEGGQHYAVRLTVASNESTGHPQPLFRWIHFKQQSMNFDEFSKQALTIPGLSAGEKQGLNSMISLIRRNFIKRIQTADGGLVPHMEPRFTQIPIPTDGNLKQSFVPPSVSWLCLPYFTLENYSGLLAADSPSSFPTETLLQAKLPRTARDRDMQQAVRQQKGTPAGLCFHVSQLWCLVVDNSLLLTCGRLSEEALCGDTIEKVIKTAQGISVASSHAKIIVRYLSDVVWALPVEECKTWFAFQSHFQELWPRHLLFFSQRRLIKADQWSKIWDRAARSRAKVVLDLQIGKPPRLGRIGVLTPIGNFKRETGSEATQSRPPTAHGAQEDAAGPRIPSDDEGTGAPPPSPPPRPPTPAHKPLPGWGSIRTFDKSWEQDDTENPWKQNSKRVRFAPSMKSEPDLEMARQPPTFAVFLCLPGVQSPDSGATDQPLLEEIFAELDDWLLNQTAYTDRRAYNDCPEDSRVGVYTRLAFEGQMLTDPDQPCPSPPQRQDYERRVDLFNAADRLFRFFFPPDSEVPTVRKFWGAIRLLVQLPPKRDGQRTTSDFVNPEWIKLNTTQYTLHQISAHISSFNDFFVHADASDMAHIKTPFALIDAWMYILLGLVNVLQDEERMTQLTNMVIGRSGLMYQGMMEMLKSLSDRPLSANSVALPLELVSLMSMKLLKDVTPGLPGIRETYSSYLNSIESEITTKAPNRSHKSTLGLFEQEVSIIQWIVKYQTSILKTMERAVQISNRAIETANATPLAPLHSHRSAMASQPNMSTHRLGLGPPSHLYHHPVSGQQQHQPPFSQIQPLPDAEIRQTHSLLDLRLQDLQTVLDERTRGFSELRNYAAQLAEINNTNLATTKDRQERAIYAFTIVTVIFLPLSSVASIFGMNSSDVRDMELGQWAYWATAVPVTVLVVFFGLLWTGELGNAARWCGDAVKSIGTRMRVGVDGGREKEWERLEKEYLRGGGEDMGGRSSRRKTGGRRRRE
ncbi:magnesium transport protein cora [Cladorrhinum sp. PSN259]|nr:magnesium transport protein cora [Cladorrhinum sp. PSN259]